MEINIHTNKKEDINKAQQTIEIMNIITTVKMRIISKNNTQKMKLITMMKLMIMIKKQQIMKINHNIRNHNIVVIEETIIEEVKPEVEDHILIKIDIKMIKMKIIGTKDKKKQKKSTSQKNTLKKIKLKKEQVKNNMNKNKREQ